MIVSSATLISDLERRFDMTSDRVPVGDSEFQIMRPRNSDDLITEADYVRDERLPYWADIWPSSLILGARVLEDKGNGQSLLELGCGVGIVTLAAMSAGYDVVATDYYDDALLFTRANAWRAFGAEPRTMYADWRTWPAFEAPFDRVVAADVLYERAYAPAVASIIEVSLARGGTAIVADPGRVAADEFLHECGRRGFNVQTETRPYEAGEIRQRINLHTVSRV